MKETRFTHLRDFLMESHGWCRRVATLAARLYLGVDRISHYSRGIMVTASGNHLLTHGEWMEIKKYW